MLSIYFKTDDWHELDVDNFDIALNDTIQNIHNPVKLNTEYSKTISLPLTAKNREIIQHYSRLDSLVTTSFDPTKSIPVRVEVNGNTVFEGHFAATKFDTSRNRLEGNFYSATNTWINKLKRLTWDDLPNCLPDNFEINKNTVWESWKATPQNRSQNFYLPGVQQYKWTDWIGFAPTITGELNDFSCDAMLKATAGAETFHPWEVYGFTGAGLDIVKTIIPKPTERQMLQFRSYYQKPYIYVDNLFRLIKYYCDTNNDLPTLQWDEDWTVETNANWRNLIYFLPNLLKSDEKPMSSTVVYNLDNPLTFNNSGFRLLDPSNHTTNKESQLFSLSPVDEGQEPIISSDGWINGNGKSIDYILPVNFNLGFSFSTTFSYEDNPLSGWNRKMRLVGQISLQVELVDQNGTVLADSTKTVWSASQGTYSTSVTTSQRSGNVTWNLSWTMNGSGVYSHSFIATANTKYRPRYRWVFKNQRVNWYGVYESNRTLWELFCADITNTDQFEAMSIDDTINPAWYGPTNLITFQTSSRNTVSDIHRIKYAAPGRSGRKYTMKDIWSKEENNTPFMVMLKYIKMFNLVIVYDNLNDIIKIMPKEKFFAEGFAKGVEDWTNKVDFGKEMSFKPLAWEDRWIEFNYNDDDLAKMKSFKDKYGFNYGTKRIGTSYSFNNDTKQLLEGGDGINVSGEMSEYIFNMYQLNRIASQPTATTQLEEAFLVNESYMINMKDDKMADMQNCFAYRANVNTSWDRNVNRLTNGNYDNHIYITDDCQYENNNGTYCYQPVLSGNINWTNITSNVWSCNEYYCNALQLSLNNTKPKISHYCTRTLYQDGWFVNVDYCCLFATPREDYFNPAVVNRNNRDLWTTRWSNLIAEMYSEQNKLLTCWVYLTPEDYNNFKFNKFIIVDDVLYLVNKIIDYNPASLEATKCELIQVNDPNKYTTAPENEVRATNLVLTNSKSFDTNSPLQTPYIEKSDEPDYSEPFYVENISNEAETLNIVKSSANAPTLEIEYLDGTTWRPLCTTSTTAYTQTLQPGDKLYLRCNTDAWAALVSSSVYYNKITGVSKVGGNTMSLLYGNNFTGEETSFPNAANYTFRYLFFNDNNIVDAKDLLLPATTMTSNCYYGMFSGCRLLSSAPELPATTLADRCYYQMFYNCYSLVEIPALPATTLASYCYYSMFNGCISLTAAPELPATTLTDYCYGSMFYGCTLLKTAPALPATTLADRCYYQMFYGCTLLKTAPALPATTLANHCYREMFYNCTLLQSAPELPASILVSYCYAQMFYNCKILNKIKCLATDISASSCTSSWLSVVSSTGTFTKAAGVTWPTGSSGIPSGWTVVEV